MKIKDHLIVVKDFPKKGVDFADITSITLNGKAYKYCIDEIVEFAKKLNVDIVVGAESRGFITGCPVAYALEKGFVPVRKPGKLPRKVIKAEYTSEYETNILEIHKEDINKGDKVLIIDDVLATGGTMKSIIEMVEELGGNIVGLAFLLEIEELNGRDKISKDLNIKVLEKL